MGEPLYCAQLQRMPLQNQVPRQSKPRKQLRRKEKQIVNLEITEVVQIATIVNLFATMQRYRGRSRFCSLLRKFALVFGCVAALFCVALEEPLTRPHASDFPDFDMISFTSFSPEEFTSNWSNKRRASSRASCLAARSSAFS